MSEPRGLPGNQCQVHRTHYPPVLETQRHHVWPKYLGGPDEPGNLVNICGTGTRALTY